MPPHPVRRLAALLLGGLCVAGAAAAQPAPAQAQAAPSAGAAAAVTLPDGATAAPAWATQLQHALDAIPTGRGVALGVHVHDLASGVAVGLRDGEAWYLASMVKVPVAIAVLRGVEAGHWTLDTPLRVRADDRVDGAGRTNAQPLAAPLALRWLLEEMLQASDNTATDMLIGLVGLEAVQAVADALAPGYGHLTTLAEVRRQVYGQLTPAAARLRGADLLRLQALPGDAQRLQLLAQLTGEPPAQFRLRTLEAAYAAYYRGGLNAAPLAAHGQLLAALAQGRALSPAWTAWLLDAMERSRTGAQRLKAGLPPLARLAHKTGTQRRRTCDGGLLRPAGHDAAGLVVVACVRGEPSLARAEALLRAVGAALCRAGAPGSHPTDTFHATDCPAPPGPPPLPIPAGAAAGAGAAARAGRGD
jgi:beta-lactamase class A